MEDEIKNLIHFNSAEAAADDKLTCFRCKRKLGATANFFCNRKGEKLNICKKCLTAHIDNFDPETFLWILEKLDFPYIETEWNLIRDKQYSKDPFKMNGMSVLGRYLAKMKLKMWSKYTWKDNDYFAQIKEKVDKENGLEQIQEEYNKQMLDQYEKGEISESQYRTLAAADAQKELDDAVAAAPAKIPKEILNNPVAQQPFYDENNFMSADALDLEAQLTNEDKIYLAMKWSRYYTPNQWIQLEKKYNEMAKSFGIEDSDTEGTIILICKTYLKMNEAIDCGDMEGYQKLARVYDTLRKSAKVTAAQNKEKHNDAVDSIGKLVSICEQEGFIPRFATNIPQDKVDLTLRDMNNYVKKLVTEDLGFGQQIEDSLKKLQIQKELKEQDDGFSFDDEDRPSLSNDDYIKFYDMQEEQKKLDDEGDF